MNSNIPSTEIPLFSEGGLAASGSREGDPYEALDDLMVVVEALCPVWPYRGRFMSTGGFRL